MKHLLTVAISALALAASPAAAQDFAIINATLAVGDGSDPIPDGTVIVRNGAVIFAGPTEAVESIDVQPVIDGQGLWVTPGLVIAMTDLGLYDVSAVSEGNDRSASSSRFNAALDVAPAINPASQHIGIARSGGLTRALVTPAHGRSLFAGQGAMIDLGMDLDAVQTPRVFQLANLGETGASKSGGSRTAAHVELRNALREARDFAAGRWSGDGNLLTRADAQALGPVISGKQKLFVEVQRASDILVVLALKEEFARLDLVLVGAAEGWLVADEIAAAGVPVIAEGLSDLPVSFELLAATQSNVGRMTQAGVKVAIGSMRGGSNGQPRNAAQFAGNLVALTKIPGASGLSWGQALASISSIPARIAGLDNVGVLKRGAVGDLVIWDGDPLEVSTAPVRVFIDGVEQSLDTHQTRLRERYRDLDESELPKAYDW
ncbi:amidohydrolase family protein [Altererythrobacter sp. GH1-8]|uniref:amidohydrolase family protein n=1 Tax=Altererythrobacter sp. GH1-8 TaxID=3349333 RepID=UPI00374DEB55